jgi:hypothetical protein
MDSNKSQIIIYKNASGETKLDVRFEGNTVWLSQAQMADLFEKDRKTITEHIRNIFKEKELQESSVCRKFQHTATDQKQYSVIFYSLDVIIAVGYRVKSTRGTQFRIWATNQLREFIVKGFLIDDDRLKNPDIPFDYFEELERRIADIRTSEKRFYRKITDIYATSIDYDPTTKESIVFYKTVQNKVHYAITGHTAAEIVASRIDNKKSNFGLTNFRGHTPKKEELEIAKNYLNIEELTQLNALVEQYLIFASEQSRRRIPMHMKDWIDKLHGFLTLNNREILKGSGSISHDDMKLLVEKEYNKNYESQKLIDSNDYRISPDFDETINKIMKGNKK